MSWTDRFYLALLVAGSIIFVVAALADPDALRVLLAIGWSILLFAAVMRMRAQARGRGL